MKTIALCALLMMISSTAGRLSGAEPLQKVLDSAVSSTAAEFREKQLKADELAATVYDLSDSSQTRTASYRGEVRIYPASVVKLFYLAGAHRWMEDGKAQDTPELRRALHDMIVDSSNDATHYVMDVITGTTSGAELAATEMVEWSQKRNAFNRYFQSIGYTNINVNQKPWCEGPYGRERVFVGEKYGNRNALTTDATARLLSEIVLGKAVSEKRSREMMELLKRDPFTAGDADDQAHAFIGIALSPGTRLWSKAGWTSDTRHDAAYVELPNGKKLILVIFTVNHGNERQIIPTLARKIIAGI